jgi:hypothetical protein
MPIAKSDLRPGITQYDTQTALKPGIEQRVIEMGGEEHVGKDPPKRGGGLSG